MRPDREEIFGAVANERRQIAILAGGLSDAQLATPAPSGGDYRAELLSRCRLSATVLTLGI